MSISTRFRKLATSRRGAWLASYISGALLALAFAPTYGWPVLFISLPLLYGLLETAPTQRSAAHRGFAFGWGYFMAGTWWIANALLIDAAKFGWMVPFSVLGLSGVLALYFALFGALFYRWRTPSAVINVLRFSVLWVGIEYLRSVGPFGFPWNLLGYSAFASLKVAQAASLVGVFGLSLVAVWIGVLPVLALRMQGKAKSLGVLLPILAITAMHGYGAARLQQPAMMTATTLRIVQPSIPQVIKGTPEGGFEAMRILASLSAGMVLEKAAKPQATIWPETAFFDVIRGTYTGYRMPFSNVLITGAQAIEGQGHPIRLYNSVAALDGAGAVKARYDKHQLVPFGEFVPLRSVLPLDKITPGTLDFSRGDGTRTLSLEGIPPFSPLICYEAIFPWMAVDAAQRPDWLANVTNDAWYGNSPGPHQHFAMARMRAIEQGLPLVRAANNGISAMVDPYGRVVASMPLYHRGALDVMLPAPLAPTPYAGMGERLTLGIMLFLWVMSYMPLNIRQR